MQSALLLCKEKLINGLLSPWLDKAKAAADQVEEMFASGLHPVVIASVEACFMVKWMKSLPRPFGQDDPAA